MSFILGLFKVHFACPCLFHKIPQTIQDGVKHAFRLPLHQIAQDSINESTWFLFLLLPRWCLHYNQGGHSNQREVSTCLKRFMASDWSFLYEESSCASHCPHSHRSLDDYSTTCLHQCLTLGKTKNYSHVVRAILPLTPVIPSKDIIATLHQLHPFHHTLSLHLF